MKCHPTGEGTLLPDANARKQKVSGATGTLADAPPPPVPAPAAPVEDGPYPKLPPPPRVPPQLSRESLAEAVESTLGLLHLLGAALADPVAARSLSESVSGRVHVVTLCRQVQHELHEALIDSEV